MEGQIGFKWLRLGSVCVKVLETLLSFTAQRTVANLSQLRDDQLLEHRNLFS